MKDLFLEKELTFHDNESLCRREYDASDSEREYYGRVHLQAIPQKNALFMLLKNFKLNIELKVLIERIANDAKDICDMQRNWEDCEIQSEGSDDNDFNDRRERGDCDICNGLGCGKECHSLVPELREKVFEFFELLMEQQFYLDHLDLIQKGLGKQLCCNPGMLCIFGVSRVVPLSHILLTFLFVFCDATA